MKCTRYRVETVIHLNVEPRVSRNVMHDHGSDHAHADGTQVRNYCSLGDAVLLWRDVLGAFARAEFKTVPGLKPSCSCMFAYRLVNQIDLFWLEHKPTDYKKVA